MRRRILHALTVYKRVKGNARALLLTEPFWSIPMPWLLYYLPVFLSRIGLSEVQIGSIVAFSSLLNIICPPLSSWFSRKLGFKRAFLLLDSAGWMAWLMTWMLARNFMHALIATSFMSLVAMSATLWEYLLMEGLDPDLRPSVYGAIQAVYLVGNLLTPLAGYVMSEFGFKKGYRLLCAIALLSLALMYLIRARLLKEPSSVASSPTSYLVVLRFYRHRRILISLLVNFVWYFQLTIWNTFFVLYLTDSRALALDESQISVIPTISSTVQLLMTALITPGLRSKAQVSALAASYLASAATITCLFIVPRGSLNSIALFVLIDSMPSALMWPLNRALLMASVEGLEPESKARVIAITNMVSSLASAIAGPVGGFLFAQSPLLPFYTLFLLRLIPGIILFSMKFLRC